MIYFILDRAAGAVKIGFSGCPEDRLRNLQTGSAATFELVAAISGGRSDEEALHERFKLHRIRGEWFAVRDDLADFLSSLPKYVPPTRKAKTADFWNGWSSQEVSQALGIGKSTVCEIRAGKYRPSPELAIRIQRLTGRSAIALVFGELADEAA